MDNPKQTHYPAWMIISIVVIAAILMVYLIELPPSMWRIGPAAPANATHVELDVPAIASPFIVVDTGAIIGADINSILTSPTADRDAIMKQSAERAQKLHEILLAYRNQGFVVINSKSLLAYPPDIDKTSDIAKVLGITLNQSQNAK